MKKDEVIELVEIFGLTVDYDQWDEKGWVRVQYFVDKYNPECNPLVIWKDELRHTVLHKLQDYLKDVGVFIFKQKVIDLFR